MFGRLLSRILVAVAGGSIPKTAETVEVSYNNSTATTSAALDKNVSYELKTDGDVYLIRTAGTGDAAGTDAVLYAEEVGNYHTPTAQELYLSVLGVSGSGTLKLIPRSSRVG